MEVGRRGGSWWRRGLALVALPLFLTCGGGDDGGGASATLSGTAYWSGPIRGATVVAHQLVDGQRTLEVGRTTTGDDGSWTIEHDGYEHVEIDVVGGSFTEASGGEVSLDANTTLRGVALDLTIGEQRAGVTVSPWTHLAVELGRARLASGSKESTYGAAISKSTERLTNHLGFDPTKTTVAPVSASAGSPTEQVKYGLSLAGLSKLAALAALDQGATVQSINTVELTKVLARDARSSEALFDGNASELLFVGASCPPPTGCAMEGPGCYASCAVHTNTLRSRLGSAVLSFLLTPQNGTTLTRDDVAPWLEGVRTNVDPELFGNETTEPFDSIGPTITWVAPAGGATVAGAIAVEVTAADPVGVMSLTVMAETPTPMALTDTDPTPGRFAATFSTVGLAEGPLTLTATATDTEDNTTSAPRMITLNNVVGGTVSGVVFKGRVGSASVRVYQFQNGVRGTMMGQGTTASDGSFTNVMIADGYTGPLLVEAGFGGTYAEEAASATVTLDVADRLRTVAPGYADGGAIASLVVTPLTSFATTYFEYLQTSNQGGSTVPARWTTARSAMEAHFGVANIYDLTPLSPAEMTTFNAQARYGMILVGLSETARTASTLGGGDGGTFGSVMNAMRVVRVLETDLADGCWDGRQGATALFFGGTRAVSVRSTRRDLANQIVSYVADGARNQTPYAGAADILSQLDTLSSGGANMSPGSCSATGKLNPDAGTPFDQTPPVILFLGTTTAAGFVRGTVIVDAMSADPDMLDMRPTLRFTSPAGTADSDGDETDPDAHHVFDTTTMSDGPMAVSLESVDDAGNVGTATRSYTIDNVGPTITFNLTNGSWHPAPGPIVTYTVTEMNLASVMASLDGMPFSNGARVSSTGMHTLTITAQDMAGAMAMQSLVFYVDPIAPTFAQGAITPSGAVVKDTLSITVNAADNMMALGSLGSDITVSATNSMGGTVVPTLSYPPQLGGARQVVAVRDTNTVPDGQLTVRFNVVDLAGNPASEHIVTRVVDNTDPTIVISGVSDGAFYQNPVTITITQSDANVGSTIATLDGGAFTSNQTVSTDGLHRLDVTATDLAGNVSMRTVMFTVDQVPPVVSFGGATPTDGAYIRQTITINATAVDAVDPVPVVSFTSPPGLTDMDGNTANATATGSLNTTSLSDGTVTVRAQAVDDSGRIGLAQRSYTVDNTPPIVTLLAVHNEIGTVINGYVSESTATIRGTVTPGGSPTTVSLTITPTVGTVMVTPNGAGNWSYTTTALGVGGFSIAVSASDQAGNSSGNPLTSGFTVDRTPPTISLLQSSVLDERNCDVSVNVNTSSTPTPGAIGSPAVNYGACNGMGSPVRLDTATAATEVGKFTTRLTAIPSDNPLQWLPQATDGAGVGLAQAASSIQLRVYRVGQPPPATWVDTASPSLANGILSAEAYVTSAQWPETKTHTTAFTIELRAVDRLGNASDPIMAQTLTRSWFHRPLAPPVLVRYVGLTNPNDPDLGTFSIFKHSLTPSGSQVGLASAISSGFFNDAPRGLYEYDVWNPHQEDINVGFYVPSFNGGSYTSQVWEVNPFITDTPGIVNNPSPAICGWPAATTSFRMSGGSAPFTCGGGTTCTCFSGGSPEPTDSKPAATNGAITTGSLSVVAWDATTATPQRLTPQSLTPTLDGYTFYEFTIPGRASASNIATHMRVMVSLPNLDLFSPADDPATQTVLESDGSNAEFHIYRMGANSFQPTMTVVFKERWGDCRATSPTTGFCTNMHARRRLRATVQAALSVPAQTLKPYVRARATAATTAVPEGIPAQNVRDGLFASTAPAISWASCETGSIFPCPTIPDFAFGVAF